VHQATRGCVVTWIADRMLLKYPKGEQHRHPAGIAGLVAHPSARPERPSSGGAALVPCGVAARPEQNRWSVLGYHMRSISGDTDYLQLA